MSLKNHKVRVPTYKNHTLDKHKYLFLISFPYFVGFAWRRVWSRRRRSRVHVTAQHRDLTIVVVAVNKLTSEVCLVAANNNFGNDRGRRPNDDYGIDIMEGHGFCFAQGGLSSRSMVLLTRLTFPENM